MPPVASLLPQRGPMVLLDELVECTVERARAVTTLRADAWYASRDGTLPGWIAIELMAQTVAAFVGYRRRLAGQLPRPGYLLGTRRLRCSLARFAPGCRLETVVRQQFEDDSGLAAFDCEILADSRVVCEATLKVYDKPHGT